MTVCRTESMKGDDANRFADIWRNSGHFAGWRKVSIGLFPGPLAETPGDRSPMSADPG
jgi:hypothetical protein